MFEPSYVFERVVHGLIRTIAGASAVLAALSCPVEAEDLAAFYGGKRIQMVIGWEVGGGYDIYARLLARHLGRHIPGQPSIVPQNMPGAGSRVAANWLYNIAPKDGTAIATIGTRHAARPGDGRPGRAL